MGSEIHTVGYWLNWRVFLCRLTILSSGAVAVYLIVRFERPLQENVKDEKKLYEDDGWKPSLRCIHLVCLLVIRFISFSLLQALIIYHAILRGGILDIGSEYCLLFDSIGPREQPKVAGLWTIILQIIFQMQAGAIVFTFSIFWVSRFHILSAKNLIKACVHSVNLVLVLIETAFNNFVALYFPEYVFSILPVMVPGSTTI
ncbi:uncharacterized protein [Rutidosis leptorrhynchoides]|uniref:uncharacterized protein n=1 Tax=Rutidosis leptorrhynchoides TaxID=125765 RepID=UPI003A99D0A2